MLYIQKGGEIINTYPYDQGVTSTSLNNSDNINSVIPWYPDMSNPDYATVLMVTYTRQSQYHTVEVDIAINKYKPWANAVTQSHYNIQNVMTHEMGHAIGLTDKYNSFASEWTMYGYAEIGETKKNSPHAYDIQAMKRLYGIL